MASLEHTRAPSLAPALACTCPACGAPGMRVFLSIDDVPSNSCILWDNREDALGCQTGDIRLAVCENCGFVANIAFDPARTEYSGRYEETQAYSATFDSFHRKLAKDLVSRFDLHGKHVVEVGCGKGEFLALLCDLGDNRGLGIDPGVNRERLAAMSGSQIDVIADYFDPAMITAAPDLLACKMTLEHIPDPQTFCGQLGEAVAGEATVLFVQVPDATRIFETCALEDIYYEHCNYFTPASLKSLVQRTGFAPDHVETTYGGQYLTLEARPANGAVAALEDAQERAAFLDLLDSFSKAADAFSAHWNSQLSQWAAQGKSVAIWGSGSKAVSFLSCIDVPQQVTQVVDINPHRQGHYMPRTAHRIVAPAELPEQRPDVVLIMNAIYREEITADLAAHDLAPEIVCL